MISREKKTKQKKENPKIKKRKREKEEKTLISHQKNEHIADEEIFVLYLPIVLTHMLKITKKSKSTYERFASKKQK